MQVSIPDLAKQVGVLPGHVLAVLQELGIAYEHADFTADEETLELVREAVQEHKGSTKVTLPPNRTPRDLAFALGVPDKEVQKTLVVKLKKMATLTQTLESGVAEKVAEALGFQLVWATEVVKPVRPKEVDKQPVVGKLLRPPVVTILGHVDHGKTSLLDYIRKANVAEKEHGGITQHIGAYQVELQGKKITFLDTPGHEAFTAMRARGAQCTDIAVLVVAADDGIMPQTIEAISHAKAAKVPIIVALNKIDKPNANPDRVMQQLPRHELVPEAYGGETIVCPVSAHTGEGIDHLLEMILLQADVMDLQADPKAPAKGIVIEAKLERGRGTVATVLVQQGTLRSSDVVSVGSTWGKIKAMGDYTGERLAEAGPSTPAEILGLNEVPKAGDLLVAAGDERSARDRSESMMEQERAQAMKHGRRRISLRDLRKRMEEGEVRDLNLILKSDVQGSVEAVRGLVDRLSEKSSEVNVRVIHSGLGSITESDILLASASEAGAICVGFNVKPEAGAKREAEKHKVEIRTYTIIYELIEDIEKAVKGMLAPKFEDEYQGTVEVRAVFKLTRAGKVAGCHVTDGKILRNSNVRVKRGAEIVYEGKVQSLRNVKQDVREMSYGQDCGLKFEGWEDFLEGDLVEAYEVVQVD